MSNEKKFEWLLRIGVAGEFAGHGLLAIGGKASWVGWISQLTGVMDVIVAAVVLLRPVRPILLWAAFWGFWTALVRPLVGESILDFIERFANWAAPLALYFYYRSKSQ